MTAASVANKGEPFISGLPDTAEDLTALLQPHSMQLKEHLGPRQMAAKMLPHLAWNDSKPPIASFYSYAVACRVPSEISGEALPSAAAAARMAEPK